MDMAATLEWQMWVTLGMVAVAIVLYSLDRFSLEMVSAGTLVALLLFFHFFPVIHDGEVMLASLDLLAGFASPALFAIMGLLIIGQGMFQSGVLERPTRAMLRAFDKRPIVVVAGVFLFVMLISAFLNNTPVVIMFIPILSAIASQSGTYASKYMIPLSFVSILGGMTTLIGSSTNLLAAAAYTSATGNEIGFFDLSLMGGILAFAGVIYLTFASRSLLPDREQPDMAGAAQGGKQFIAQITLGRGHPLIGLGSVAGLFPDLPDVTVRMIQRREEAILPPFDDINFRLHDTIIIAATRKALTNLLKTNPDILSGLMSEVQIDEDSENKSNELTMVEALVAPGSRLIGRTIAQIGFRYQTNCVILGIQRRSRMIRTHMNSIRLEAGDVLLMLGDMRDIRALRTDRDIVVLEYSMTGLPDAVKARRASFIFALVIASAAFGVLPIAVAAIAGASLMVAAGCLNIRQAARAIDRRIYLLIGSALAMGVAIEKTGGAALIGETLVGLMDIGGTTALISGFFIITAILTNVLSNNATAVLFTPIAVNAALAAEIDPLVLVLTVIFGANCSFATPVAYQTNLLVMAPGHYRFRDYLTIGLPLILLLWVVYTLVAPLYFRQIGLL
jgi:di/tricarboxylate transporter